MTAAPPISTTLSPTCRAEDFLTLEEDWRRLSALAHHASAFLSWEWASCWVEAFLLGDEGALQTLVVRDLAGDAVGIVPLYKRHLAPGWGLPCRSREWRLLGNTGRDYESLTDEPIFLARAGWESDVRDAALRWLCTEARGEWDYVKLGLRDGAGDGALPALPEFPMVNARAGKRLGPAVRDLPADWPTLRKQLSRSMRDNTAYYPRLLTRHGHTTRLRFLRSEAEVREGLPTVIALHRHRARSEACATEHVSHIPEPRHAGFLMDCLPRLALAGGAFLVILEAGGIPIAAQAFLEARDSLAFYYSGFDTDWQQYSPLLIRRAGRHRGRHEPED